MGIVVAIVNQKGGVGKTTTAVNLGAALAALEKRTLVIDLDPQANATSGTGFPKRGIPSMYGVLVEGHDIHTVVQDAGLPTFRLAPSSIDLVGADLELSEIDGREGRLRVALEIARDEYDFILIDCPPSLGLLTVNALTAADVVVVPLQAEYYALEGVSQLVDTVDRVRETLNPELEIGGIILTMFDERVNLSRQVADEIRNFFAERVFETVIPRNVRLAEAPSFGKPILMYDVKSRGSEAYIQLAQEFTRRLEVVIQ
ncbi:MAG: ParA family protein [Acidobacteria bacterium]|nr:ParA family protein [Acidobacteriota bacterium]